MEKQTIQQQRVELAKDVINHIENGKLIGENMTYLAIETDCAYMGKSLRKILGKFKQCKACALGGMFYALIMRRNNYNIETDINSILAMTMRNMLGEIFTQKQLLLVESAFEKTWLNDLGDYSSRTTLRAQEYRYMHKLYSGSEILEHIMNNIISNNGTFKP